MGVKRVHFEKPVDGRGPGHIVLFSRNGNISRDAVRSIEEIDTLLSVLITMGEIRFSRKKTIIRQANDISFPATYGDMLVRNIPERRPLVLSA